MKLVGIEFHGFKSFADSADIGFHDGITAIVGPNGCGKSNVADGLRWVLGEQRPTCPTKITFCPSPTRKSRSAERYTPAAKANIV